MAHRVLFLDLNSYFASVEQAVCPSLMGKPVAVVPMLADTTCCLAASYPAKSKGIRTGTLVKDAKKLCPGITLIQADHRKYVSYHHKIIKAVERCLPVWKVFSIDEMAIRLFGREQEEEFVRAKAAEIKKRIAEEVHPALTCSIGVAPNRYLAKVASDMQKPDGFTILHQEELPQKLFSLHIRDFPGIGPRMEERFVAAGCATAKTLCQKSLPEMRKLWGGKYGEDFWNLLRGEELPEKETVTASLGHSKVLGPDSRNPEAAFATLIRLTSKAAMRLRAEGFYTQSMSLGIKLLRQGDGDTYWEKKAKFSQTQDSVFLIEQMSELWRDAPQEKMLRVGVTLSSFVSVDKKQLSLFEDSKQTQLMHTLDSLNKKYRKNLIMVAANPELKDKAHAPIAFSHIPDEFE